MRAACHILQCGELKNSNWRSLKFLRGKTGRNVSKTTGAITPIYLNLYPQIYDSQLLIGSVGLWVWRLCSRVHLIDLINQAPRHS